MLSNKINEAMMLNRVKVLPALRELISQCMQQQRFVEKHLEELGWWRLREEILHFRKTNR